MHMRKYAEGIITFMEITQPGLSVSRKKGCVGDAHPPRIPLFEGFFRYCLSSCYGNTFLNSGVEMSYTRYI